MKHSNTKHQLIRLADVIVIGPVMIYGGLRGEGLHTAARLGLLTFGIGTVIFNGINWLKIRSYKR